ncbi:hypothetical protein ANCDUO_12646, partial [Ancylostoma duodenale]
NQIPISTLNAQDFSINQRREGDVDDENVRDDVGRSAGRRALLPHGRLRQRSGPVWTAGERASGHALLDKGELQVKSTKT